MYVASYISYCIIPDVATCIVPYSKITLFRVNSVNNLKVVYRIHSE